MHQRSRAKTKTCNSGAMCKNGGVTGRPFMLCQNMATRATLTLDHQGNAGFLITPGIRAIIMNHLSSDNTGGRRGWVFAVNVLLLTAFIAVSGSQARLLAQTANFTPSRTAICPGSYITYTNTSTWPSGAGRTFAWSFPGGFPNADTSRNPLVYYATPGLYTVNLTVCSGGICDTETRNAYIRVHSAPASNFSWSIPDACQGDEIQFTDLTAPGSSAIASWFWDFDDGSGDATQNPLHGFPALTTYEVILLVTDANGCQDDVAVNVTPQPGLQGSFSIDQPLDCGAGPLNVTASGSATGGLSPYSYTWNFGNGDVGAGVSDATVYNGCGLYDMTMVVSDQNGCTDTIVDVGAVNLFCPNVNFTMSADTVCAGEPLLVFDASLPGGGTSAWQFDMSDPGSTSGGINTGYVYSTPGVYTIQHCMDYANGCQECVTRDVVVRNKPIAGSISISQSNSCQLPFSPTLTAVGVSGTPPISYEWQIGSATYYGPVINPTFTAPGVLTVYLIVTDGTGCSDTIVSPNLIRIRAAVPAFTLSTDLGCAPLPVTITNTSFSPLVPIDSFVWDLGDGTAFSSTTMDTFNHVFSAVGDYTVSLITYTALGCTDTVTALVQVGEVDADFYLLRDTTCSTAQLMNETLNADYTIVYWGNGDSTVLPDPLGDYTYFYFGITAPTNFTITLVAYFNGCSQTVTQPILVTPPFGFDRTVTRDCSDPYTVTLWVDPTVLSGPFCWDAGTGDTLCNVNPATFTFPDEGVYTVYIRNPGNALFDTVCVLDYFEIPIVNAVASFVADDLVGCGELTSYFSNTNTDPIFDTLTYRWEIGPSLINGITFTSITVGDDWAYYFAQPDIYPIRMVPLDSTLCNVGYTGTAVVSEPTALFLVDSVRGCDPATVYFRDSSYSVYPDPRMDIVQWTWTFDNPSCPVYVGRTPPPCSYSPGTYEVGLRVRDAAGCVSIYGEEIIIAPTNIQAGFTYTAPVCGNDSAYFFNGSTGSSGLASYFWQFGDGATSTEANPKHVYATSGSYSVRLTVTDSVGCSDPLTRVVVIDLSDVTPNFTVTYFSAGICPPIPVQLTNTSTGTVTAVQWYVETSTGVNYYTGNTAIHTYTMAGNYDITMVVTDSRGCTDTLTRTDNVTITGPTGDLALSPTSGCAPLDVFFDLENINADQVFIDFGNGDTLQVFGDFIFTYNDPGTYCPRMILLDSLGCETQYNCPGTITVYDVPAAALSLSDPLICDGNALWVRNETDLSALISPIVSTVLDFGDGTVNTMAGTFDSLSHNYGASGFYTVRMVLENAGGCIDTVEAVVAVGEIPTGTYSLTPAMGCDPVTATVTLGGVFADSAFVNFGNGVTMYADSAVSYTYTTPGVYVPSLYLQNNTGCSAIIANGDPMVVGYAPQAALLVPDNSNCQGESFVLTNASVDTVSNPLINPIDQVAIYANGSLLASGASLGSVLYIPLAPGTYPVMLIASNDLGCTDTAFAEVTTHPEPVAAYMLTDAVGCAPVTAGVNIISLLADSAWVDFGDGTTLFSDTAVSHTYALPGIYYPVLILRDTTGCNNIIANGDPITVGYAPQAVLAIPDNSNCEGESFALQNLSVDTVSNPLINPIDDLQLFVNGVLVATGPPMSTVLHTPSAPGTYEVLLVASSDLGCLDTASALVTSVPLPSGVYDLLGATGCAPLTMTAELTGLAADSAWMDFGDGNTVLLTGSLDYTYPLPGVYVPVLTLRDSSGCSLIVANGDPVTVGHQPEAVLAVPDATNCEGEQFTFINLSQDTITNPALNAIDQLSLFVDGVLIASGPPLNSVLFSPVGVGVFTVTLVASSDLGCADTAQTTVETFGGPRGAYVLSGAIGCAPVETHVDLPGLLADSAWIDFGDGSLVPVTGSMDYLYTTPGIYEPRLILQDNNGCSLTVFNGDPVTVAYRPEARLAVPDSSQCARETFTLINLSVDTVTNPTLNAIDDLRLYFDGALLASGLAIDTVLFTASNAGDFPVELIALNDLGCVDTARRNVVVHPVPLPDAGAEARVCQGAEVALDGSGTLGATNWSWTPADLVSDPSAEVTTAVLTGGDVMFYLNVDNGLCAAVDSVRVRIIQDLNLVPGPDAEICRDGTVPLSAQVDGTVPGISWIWTPAADLSDPYSLNPIASPDNDAAYTITVTCGTLEEAATLFVDILEPPTVEAWADTTLLILGSTVQLESAGSGGNGALEIWWAQNPDLSCTDCPNPLATPQQDGWYLVYVQDEAGCVDLDSIFLRVFTDCLGDDFELGKAFTPNGDGANDKMEYRSETIGVLNQFRVWNRWGELVFETNDRTEFWDGTYRGQPMDPAVFAFTMQGVCINGENFLRTGDITLIR